MQKGRSLIWMPFLILESLDRADEERPLKAQNLFTPSLFFTGTSWAHSLSILSFSEWKRRKVQESEDL